MAVEDVGVSEAPAAHELLRCPSPGPVRNRQAEGYRGGFKTRRGCRKSSTSGRREFGVYGGSVRQRGDRPGETFKDDNVL